MMPVIFNSFIALFFLGFIPTLVKLTSADVVTIGLVRLFIAIVLFRFLVVIRRKKIKFTKQNILPCILIGLCFGLHWLFYFLSIRYSTVAVASFCVSTNGLIMVFFGRFLFHERLSKTDMLALFATLAGALLVVPNYHFGDRAALGFGLGILNAFLFAAAATMQKYYSKTIDNETRTFSQYFFALPVFFCLWKETHWKFEVSDWLILGFLGVFCTFVAHTLWIRCLERLAAKTAAIFYYLSTLFAVIIGAIWLGEIPAFRVIVGGLMIIVGGLLVVMNRKTT